MIDLYDLSAIYEWKIPDNPYGLNGTEVRVTGHARLQVNFLGQPVQVQPTNTPDPRNNGKFLVAPPGVLVQKFVSLKRRQRVRKPQKVDEVVA